MSKIKTFNEMLKANAKSDEEWLKSRIKDHYMDSLIYGIPVSYTITGRRYGKTALQDQILGNWEDSAIYDNSPVDTCEHEPINVGFHFDKIICKKCNKDLK